MTVIVNGRVVHAQPWHQRAIAFLWSLVNAVSFFFQTLLAPEATDAYKKHARRKGWNAGGSGGGRLGGGGGGGGGGGVRARSRFGDMGTLKDNNHSAACGAGG